MSASAYSVVWEFFVRSARQAEFERRYGPDGSWARLFRQANGFLGLELFRDRENPLRYLTLDRWSDEESYHRFQERFAREYAALDRECEGLTERETALGGFGTIA